MNKTTKIIIWVLGTMFLTLIVPTFFTSKADELIEQYKININNIELMKKDIVNNIKKNENTKKEIIKIETNNKKIKEDINKLIWWSFILETEVIKKKVKTDDEMLIEEIVEHLKT